MQHFQPVIISVCLTTQCNYNCQYCISTQIQQKTYIDINKLLYFIDCLQKRINILQINIEGDGEPTLHPQFFDFCQQLKLRNIKAILHTNFSQPILFYQKCIKLENIQLVLTWHSTDNNKFNKQFFLKLNQCIKEKLCINLIKIAFEPSNVKASLFAYKVCNSTFAKQLLLCQPLSQYSDNELLIYKNTIDMYNSMKLQEKSCNKELCYIDSTNNIYKCYTQYRNNNSIMSLYSFDIDKLFDNIVCNNFNEESCY